MLKTLRKCVSAYRIEIALFLGAIGLFFAFSAKRFLRQSEAPHFVYQAKAWLNGQSDIDLHVLPNLEDWACVREVNGEKQRCEKPLQPGDTWYSSFPWFPAVAMLPFVALHGYQFNDTSFIVIVAALSIALFYSLLRRASELRISNRRPMENAALAVLLGIGTAFFQSAIRGEVWFSAHVLGVTFTALYLNCALNAHRPLLAGLFWSMSVLTRTPLVFTGIFFVLEAVGPIHFRGKNAWRKLLENPRKKLRLLGGFFLGATPLGLLAMGYNQMRFGSITEFGHRFLFNNRCNADIDTWGLFDIHYLLRNLDAAFLKLPIFQAEPFTITYSPWGMSLFLTLPLIALAVVPSNTPKRLWTALGAMGAVLLASLLFPQLKGLPQTPPVGNRATAAWIVLAGALCIFTYLAYKWVLAPQAPRLVFPALVTIFACMLPGMLYQNTGYAQFGYRFSIDYLPYIFLLVALSGWNLRKPVPFVLATQAILVNVWGALVFSGVTEHMRAPH